jgi:lysophospholipase L1-like esterase
MNRVRIFLKNTSMVLFIFILILILGHFIIQGAMIMKRLTSGMPIDDLLVLNMQQGDFGYNAELHPWYYWKTKPRVSEDVNINNNGVRRTIKSPDRDAKKIFMFGGSTTWGWGVDDSNTIPSLLQKKIGSGYDVYNYGVPAFMSIQETNYLLEELWKSGAPDIVIFYDGVNDGYDSLYSPGIVRETTTIRRQHDEYTKMKNLGFLDHIVESIKRTNWGALFNYAIYGRSDGLDITPFSKRWDDMIDDDSISDKIKRTLDYWVHNTRQVRAIGKEYGFETYFFWQPNSLNGTKKMTQTEISAIATHNVTNKGRRIFKDLYTASKKRLTLKEDLGIYFLGDAFKDVSETLYIDSNHLNKLGNQLIADKMFSVLNKSN